jgi:LysR family transcriptional regulator of abg operon
LFVCDSQGVITVRLTQIRDFLAVIDTGSVRGAARKLGVSQPTVTKSVRGLEAELQVQLIQRSVRGIVPTPSGRAFYARARVAHSELRKAEEEASQLSAPGVGSVAFGIGPVGTTLVLPQAVKRFHRQFPHVRVRVVENLAHVLLPLVRDETLDFVVGLRRDTKLDPMLRFRPMYRSEIVIAARKGHPLGDARSLAQLAHAAWLGTPLLVRPGGLDRTFASAGLSPPVAVIHCESYNSVVALLANTDMVGFMQRRQLQEPYARDFLKEITVAQSLPSVTAGMYTRADTPLTLAAAAMAKAIFGAARLLVRPS